MDREKIIDEIKRGRKYIKNPFKSCSFERSCPETCGSIFPRFKRTIREESIVDWLNGDCPCNFYSKGYVKRRMKKLFPELYEDTN